MMADDSLDILAKENNSGQLENTGKQQPPAVHLGYYDDNIAAGFSGGNYATLQMDEGDTQFTHLGQDANNPNGHAAVKQGSDQETKNDYWNLNLDYSMAKPEHDDQAHSSGIQHMSELPRGAPQDAIMNDEFLYQEHEGSKYLNLQVKEVSGRPAWTFAEPRIECKADSELGPPRLRRRFIWSDSHKAHVSPTALFTETTPPLPFLSNDPAIQASLHTMA